MHPQHRMCRLSTAAAVPCKWYMTVAHDTPPLGIVPLLTIRNYFFGQAGYSGTQQQGIAGAMATAAGRPASGGRPSGCYHARFMG